MKVEERWGSTLPAWPFVAFATALAFGLALHKLGHASFWGDEFETWGWAHLSFDRIREVATGQYHTPLYFWFMHGWVRLGASSADEFWLRLPSAFFFALTVPLAYSIGRSLSGAPRAGVYAALLAATFPFLLEYGQQARSWAMVTFFAACGFAAAANMVSRWRDREEARPGFMWGPLQRPPRPRFMRGPLLLHVGGAPAPPTPPGGPPRPRLLGAGLRDALRPAARGELRSSNLCGGRSCGPHTPGNALGDDGPWVAYIVSSVVAMHLHNTLGLFLLVTGLILVCSMLSAPPFRGVRFASLGIAMAIIALFYLPRVSALLGGMDRIDLSYRIAAPSVELVFLNFSRVYGYAHLSAWGWLPLVVLVGLALLALTAWGRRGEWHRVAFALVGWLVAPALLVLFSFWKPILSPNLLTWTVVPFLAACAAGLTLVPLRLLRFAALAGLLALNLEGVAREWNVVEEDWRGAAEIIARDASPGTAVLYCPVWRRGHLNHYLERLEERPDIDAWGLRATGDRRRPGPPQTVVFLRLPAREPAGFEPVELFSRYRRVYVVRACLEKSAESLLHATLSEWEKLAKGRKLPDVPILLYERGE